MCNTNNLVNTNFALNLLYINYKKKNLTMKNSLKQLLPFAVVGILSVPQLSVQ